MVCDQYGNSKKGISFFGPYGQVTRASDGASVDLTNGDYYWGKVKGKPNSLAAISIFENAIEGLLYMDGETFNLGKVENIPFHIMYRADDVAFDQPECLAESLADNFDSGGSSNPIPETSSTTVGSVGV